MSELIRCRHLVACYACNSPDCSLRIEPYREEKTLSTADGIELPYHVQHDKYTEVVSYYLRGVPPGRTTANFVPPEAVKNYRAEDLSREAVVK